MPFDGGYAHDLAAGDFDGDGDADVALINGIIDQIVTLANDGSGVFSSPTVLQAGPGTLPFAIAAADLNSDGILDLAVGELQRNRVTIWRGGAGGFRRDHHSLFVSSPVGMDVADFDADGRLDVFVTSLFQDRVTVLRNEPCSGITTVRRIRH